MSEAYFTLSKKTILNQYKKVKNIADIVSYSSKTNPLVTPILEENTDCLFSIHLLNELKNVRDKSRIFFLAQGLDDELLDNILNQGVRRLVVDNIQDLDFLIDYLETKDFVIKLFLRMKLKENTLRTEQHFVFGISSSVVNEKIKLLAKNKKISSLGIHMHRKTQNMAEWNYEYELERLIDSDVWEIIDEINIGGGLPSVYANTNAKVVNSIFLKLEKLRNFISEKKVKLMIEPGRFIAAPSGSLHTTIKLVYDNNIIVNASVYNTDMDALIVPVKLLVEKEFNKEDAKANPEIKPYVIKGKTPCSMDLFRYRVYLKNPKQGDELIFINAGAYNFSTEFCDLETLPTRIIE